MKEVNEVSLGERVDFECSLLFSCVNGIVHEGTCLLTTEGVAIALFIDRGVTTMRAFSWQRLHVTCDC